MQASACLDAIFGAGGVSYPRNTVPEINHWTGSNHLSTMA